MSVKMRRAFAQRGRVNPERAGDLQQDALQVAPGGPEACRLTRVELRGARDVAARHHHHPTWHAARRIDGPHVPQLVFEDRLEPGAFQLVTDTAAGIGSVRHAPAYLGGSAPRK